MIKKILIYLLFIQNLYGAWNTTSYQPYSLKGFTSAKVTHSAGTYSEIKNVPSYIYIYKIKDVPYNQEITSFVTWHYKQGNSPALLSVTKALQDGVNGIQLQVFGEKLKFSSGYTSSYYYTATDLAVGKINSMSVNARIAIDADKNIGSVLDYDVGVRVQGSSILKVIRAKIYVKMALILKAFSLDFGSYMIGSSKKIKASTPIFVEGAINSDIKIELESQDIYIQNSSGDRLSVRLELDGAPSKDINLGYDGEEKVNLEAEVVDTPTEIGDYYGTVKINAVYI